ncbi:MAG TPA: PIN domain nuclease [Spirochaeta sp.]|nr:PIN domain nuclease [Spirochaeta sp.]
MNYLLDTHAFLWWIADHPMLSPPARKLIADTENDIYLSTASVWEIAIKTRAGKLEITEDINIFIADNLQKNSFKILPINLFHSIKISEIPNSHRDPFDQMLAAQSIVENMPILSRDMKIAELGAELIW